MQSDRGNQPGHRIDVLVVDDSAIVRRAFVTLLGGHGRINVTTAPDAAIARQRMSRKRPDVLVLDLSMPGMSGLDFLRTLMAADPLPVVICSSLAGPGSREAMRALELGAVAILTKPRLSVREYLESQADEIARVLLGASMARPGRIRAVQATAPTLVTSEPQVTVRAPFPEPTGPQSLPPAQPPVMPRIVAIGASTGGTEAIFSVLAAMPADGPPIVIVQHMPAGFTRSFARRLDEQCAVRVKEAETGDALERGLALLAPGDRHMRVVWRRNQWQVDVFSGPKVSGHCPSVDVLMQSVAESHRRNALGILLTGMGEDGADGLLAMRRAGAYTLAESESSCVVFGMPKVARDRGAVCAMVSLEQIGRNIAAWFGPPQPLQTR